MTRRTKAASRISAAVHETASDLHRLGFIDKRKMNQFDALCIETVPVYDSEIVSALRENVAPRYPTPKTRM